MKKRAYTLIETITVIAILTIFTTICMKVYSTSKGIMDEMILRNTEAEIVSILTLGKEYCYNKETKGRIYINKSERSMVLVDESLGKSKSIKTIYLPKGYDFIATFSIAISVKGVLNSETINFKDNYNNYHKITIAVGVDLISVY